MDKPQKETLIEDLLSLSLPPPPFTTVEETFKDRIKIIKQDIESNLKKNQPIEETLPTPLSIPVDMSKVDKLMKEIPLYRYTYPQEEKQIYDRWKQHITQIFRDLIQHEVRPLLEQEHLIFSKYLKEIEHIQEFEKEIYEELKKIRTTYENLQYHYRLYRSSWAKNFADKLPDLPE